MGGRRLKKMSRERKAKNRLRHPSTTLTCLINATKKYGQDLDLDKICELISRVGGTMRFTR